MEGQAITLRELHLTPDAPWPGPAAYTERDSGFFHGRAAETAELHRLLHAEPVCVLYALSGLGKTSLLQAGVFPRLRADGWLPVRVRLDHRDLDDDGLPVHPLPAQVLDLVAQAAQAQGISVPEWSLTDDTLTAAFHERGERLWGAREDEPVTPVLVFDQFEECWTQTRNRPAARARAEALLGEVAALIDWRGKGPLQPAPVRVVFSLREDQLAPLDALRPLFPGLRRARLRLLPFTAAQATEVVEIPGGCLLDDGASEAIVSTFASRDVDRPIADPALLSIFCWRLNEDRRSPERQAGTITAVRAIALRGEFVQQFYDAAFALLPPEQSLAARRFVETDLIDAAGFRSSAGFEHAEKKYDLGPGSLETLVDARLLHPVDRSGGHRHVELVHDRIGEEAMRQRTLREEAEAQAQSAAQTAQLRANLTKARLRTLILTALTFLALAAMAFALFMRQQAEQARIEAEVANKKTMQALAAAEAANVKTKQALTEADYQRSLAQGAAKNVAEQTIAANQSRDKALAAKKSANEIIQFMQYDLRDTLKTVGRLDIMDAINDRVAKHLKEHPPEIGDMESENSPANLLEQQGDILMAKGDPKGALIAYQQRHAITERLTQAHPENSQIQRNLSVSYLKIGEAQAAAGDKIAAITSYHKSLAIAERVLLQDPDNAHLQRDLAISYNFLGNAQIAVGDIKAAMTSFQKYKSVAERLVELDTTNVDWQRDMSISYVRIGEAQAASGDSASSLDSYRQAIAIAEPLAQKYPGNALLQYDLSFNYDMIGGAQTNTGNAEAALASHQKSLDIRKLLAKQDPDNTIWQRGLSGAHKLVSQALQQTGDESGAMDHAKTALKIDEKLSALNPANATWQNDLKTCRAWVAWLQAQGKK